MVRARAGNAGKLADEPRGIAGIGPHHLEDRLDVDRAVAGMPAIVIGDHRHRRVAELRLAGELGLRHVGHADHVAAPRAVELRFGEGRELRALHHEIGAAALAGDADCPGCRLDAVARSGADRLGQRHMRDAAGPEEALLAREGAVDELVDEHEVPGAQLLAQRATGRERHQVGDPGALQRIDVGAVVDLARRDAVAAPVPRQEHDLDAVDRADAEFVRRLAPGRRDRHPVGIVHRHVIDAGTADHSEHRFGHAGSSLRALGK